MIKALSLHQPWASLIAIGAKKYETRHWSTNYRGLLAICAAKRWTHEQESVVQRLYRTHGTEMWGMPHPYPLGAALCIVKLREVYPTWTAESPTSLIVGGAELAFGDWTPGRFAWQLELVKTFKEPIPMRGRQGLFNIELDWENTD